MNIEIRNTLGVERADIVVSPIALLSGLNGAGKTSTLTAIGCALTGITMPASLPKKDAKVIVRDGADGSRKAWWVDVLETAYAEELTFLRTEIYGREVDLPKRRITAFDRFSERVA